MFAWTGATIFVASLSYFVFSYVVTWGVVPPAGGSHPTAAVAWNTGLFSLFALHHSVFAREPIRTRVSRLVTPARERAFYVWVASLLFIAVCALWNPVPGALWRIDGIAGAPLWALQAFGAWLTVRSAAIIDIWELSGVAQARAAGRGLSASPGAPDKARPMEFKVQGPYAWVRHPIYTGWFLLVFAVGTMTMTRLVFAVVSCAYLVIAIPFEERSLLTSSDGAYERYSHQVRWKLFPWIY